MTVYSTIDARTHPLFDHGSYIASFNLRGLRCGLSMLHELCKSFQIIAYQEHWLRPEELASLSIVSPDNSFHTCAGMPFTVSKGLIVGRPFAVVGFSWHNSLNPRMELVESDSDDRCCMFRLKHSADRKMLLANIYMLCADNSAAYKN